MEKVLIDTSVWIPFFRGRDKSIVEAVSKLLTAGRVVITGIVITELLQGASEEKELEKILRLLEPVERIDLVSSDWEKGGRLSYRLRRRGATPSTLDILLATLAIENDCLFYTADKHFELVAKHSDLRLYPASED